MFSCCVSSLLVFSHYSKLRVVIVRKIHVAADVFCSFRLRETELGLEFQYEVLQHVVLLFYESVCCHLTPDSALIVISVPLIINLTAEFSPFVSFRQHNMSFHVIFGINTATACFSFVSITLKLISSEICWNNERAVFVSYPVGTVYFPHNIFRTCGAPYGEVGSAKLSFDFL